MVFRGSDLLSVDIERFLSDVRQELHADSASILLLDDSGMVLEPIASVGLGRTSRGAARVPVGRGFAGQIALTRQPRSIVEITQENVLNPLLLAFGIRSLLGVPVLHGSQLIGVLHVGTRSPRDFADDDVAALSVRAGELGRPIEQQRAGAERTAALVLQRSLVPGTITPISGFDIAARYIPAEGDLGGDWYDVFELPDGGIGFLMGDVVGHGLQAAVVMGRLRSALRAYALDYASPAEVLRRLDRKISHFEDGAFATALYGVTHPPFDTVVFSCAGHWAPLIARPGEIAVEVELPHDPMLGIGHSVNRHDSVIDFGPHATLCLFTDGLVERRPSITDPTDLTARQMRTVLLNLDSSRDAESTCSRIVNQAVGDDVIDDDIALLVIRRVGEDL
jgi:sigma-B regulation protein RsbU (phosphoserine phosphatase)